MKISSIPTNRRTLAYLGLFGTSIYKGMPLYSYAENLFYNGLNQMIPAYTGEHFDFITITNADVDIEKTGFMPVITSREQVSVTTPYGLSATLSYHAACILVWVFVLEQIGHSISDADARNRIFMTIQDIKYCFGRIENDDGSKYITPEHCAAMEELFN